MWQDRIKQVINAVLEDKMLSRENLLIFLRQYRLFGSTTPNILAIVNFNFFDLML